MNENANLSSSQPGDKKSDRILIVRLPEGSVVLEAAHMDVDDKADSLLARHLKTIISPFSQATENYQQRPEGVNALHGQRTHHRKKRRINWVRVLNFAFIVFVTLTALIPAFLSSALGIAIFASATDAPDAKINHGDMMISKIMSAGELGDNDVLLLHNDYTWDQEIRRVISRSTAGDMITITTSDGVDQNSTDAYTVKQSTKIHKVIRIVPKFGSWLMVFTSIPAKILGGIVLIAINLAAQIRRARRLRNGL